MEVCHAVYYGTTEAGKVQIIQQGLYCRVICRCRIEGDQVCRLFAVNGSKRENLGVVVPDGDGFFLDRKIPAKRLSGDNVRFVLSAGSTAISGKFVPICPEEPFLYIERLKNSFLQSEHGKIGIRIEENPEAV